MKQTKKHAVVFFDALWQPLYYMKHGKMIKCLNCNKELNGRRKKFCSHSCGSKYWNKTHKEKCIVIYSNFLKRNPNHIKDSYEKYKEKYKGRYKRKYNGIRDKQYYKEYMKKYVKTNKYKLLKKKYHKEELQNKVVHRARQWAYKKRDKKCKKCGSKEKLEFHHTDYDKNLGVTLCIPCHKEIHNKNKMEESKQWK